LNLASVFRYKLLYLQSFEGISSHPAITSKVLRGLDKRNAIHLVYSQVTLSKAQKIIERYHKFVVDFKEWKDNHTAGMLQYDTKIVTHHREPDYISEEEIQHKIRREVDIKENEPPEWIVKNSCIPYLV